MAFAFAPSTPPTAAPIPVLDSPTLRELQPAISILDSPEPSRSVWQPMISAMDSPEPLCSPSVEDWTHRFSENDWGHWIDVFGETVQETMQEILRAHSI